MIPTEYERTGLSFTIGRSADCDFVIPAEYGKVSGHHATIHQCRSPYMPNDVFCYFLEDYSTNGSTVNGQSFHMATAPITKYDTVVLGNSYALDLMNFFRIYFESKTTSQKPVSTGSEQQSPFPSITGTGSNNRPTKDKHGGAPQNPVPEPPAPPQPPQVVTVTVPGSPAWWWWLLLLCVAALAFFLGVLVA